MTIGLCMCNFCYHADACSHVDNMCVMASHLTHLKRPTAVHTARKDPLESQATDREPSIGFCTEYMQPSARSPLAEW